MTSTESQDIIAARRLTKAQALAGCFIKRNVTPDTISALDDRGWRIWAEFAQVNYPSEATRAITVALVSKWQEGLAAGGLAAVHTITAGHSDQSTCEPTPLSDEDREAIENEALSVYEPSEFELTGETSLLPDGRTAYRVKVLEHVEDECYADFCPDDHYAEIEDESYWAVVLPNGEVESNVDLEDLQANIIYELERQGVGA